MTAIIAELSTDGDSDSKFDLQLGVLKYKGRLVLSKNSSLIPAIWNIYHDSVLGGHSGFLRTYRRLTGELYWLE